MDTPANQRWIWMAMVVALVYPAVGILFAWPANSSASNEMRVTWRLAAWLVSAAAFVFHLAYERSRLRNPPSRAAWHVSLAVALGAFLLAVWVNVHGHWAAPSHPSSLALLALVLFPVVTGVPAFVLGFVALAVLARVKGGR